VDDYPAIRTFVRTTLGDDYEIVGEGENGLEAITLARQLQPDLIVLDVSMPILGGFPAAREIRAEFPEVRIIFLSQQTNRLYVEEAFRIGAQGYVLKSDLPGELREAVRAVQAGHSYRPAAIT
jgi:DNA-binding NarL/FixJ family response regulator